MSGDKIFRRDEEERNAVFDRLRVVNDEMREINELLSRRDNTIEWNSRPGTTWSNYRSMSGLKRAAINRRIMIMQEDIHKLRRVLQQWASEG